MLLLQRLVVNNAYIYRQGIVGPPELIDLVLIPIEMTQNSNEFIVFELKQVLDRLDFHTHTIFDFILQQNYVWSGGLILLCLILLLARGVTAPTLIFGIRRIIVDIFLDLLVIVLVRPFVIHFRV